MNVARSAARGLRSESSATRRSDKIRNVPVVHAEPSAHFGVFPHYRAVSCGAGPQSEAFARNEVH